MLGSDNNCCFQNWEDCTFLSRADNQFLECVGDNVTGAILVRRGGDIARAAGPTSRNYGRKPYMGDLCYDEMMERPTWRAMLNQRLEEKSQFEKPYLDDAYPEMEHFYPTINFPGLFPDQFVGPVPVQGEGQTHWPEDPDGVSETECFAIMECHPDNPLEIGAGGIDDICVGGICGKEVEWAILNDNPHAKITYTYDNFDCEFCQPIACARIQIAADAPDGEQIHIRARDVLRYDEASLEEDVHVRRIRRSYAEIICLIKVTERECYVGYTFTYDTGNADTIAANSSIYITIENGEPPFTWAVSGTHFSFSQLITGARVNQLIAGSGACGSATITVTDYCGNTVTGYVRCTTGVWVEKSTGVCELSGIGSPTDTYTFELIEGNKLQQQSTESKASSGSNDCASVGTTACTTNYCPEYGGSGCVTCSNCIDPDGTKFPCKDKGGEGEGYQCWCVSALSYSEWECAP